MNTSPQQSTYVEAIWPRVYALFTGKLHWVLAAKPWEFNAKYFTTDRERLGELRKYMKEIQGFPPVGELASSRVWTNAILVSRQNIETASRVMVSKDEKAMLTALFGEKGLFDDTDATHVPSRFAHGMEISPAAYNEMSSKYQEVPNLHGLLAAAGIGGEKYSQYNQYTGVDIFRLHYKYKPKTVGELEEFLNTRVYRVKIDLIRGVLTDLEAAKLILFLYRLALVCESNLDVRFSLAFGRAEVGAVPFFLRY